MTEMAGEKIYPWLDHYWPLFFQSTHTSPIKTRHHSFLIHGVAGLGKTVLAARFAKALLCSNLDKNNLPCCQCDSCHLFDNNLHPDFNTVSPQAEGKQIKVDQIRALNDFLSKTSQLGQSQIACITNADAFNTSSANAFLKNLEEPSENTYIILLHHHISPILPTIRSRCLQIPIVTPSKNIAFEWLKAQFPDKEDKELLYSLQYSKIAPLKASNFIEKNKLESLSSFLKDLRSLLKKEKSVTEVAAFWNKYSKMDLFEWLEYWLCDLIRLAFTGDNQLNHQPSASRFFMAILKRTTIDKLYLLLDQVRECNANVRRSSNLNENLMFEQLLIQWCNLVENQ